MADSKLRDLTIVGTPVLTDLLYLLADPGGSPLDRKMTLTQLRALISGLVLLDSQTASASATLDFTAISSAYETYLFELLNVLPATSTDDLWVRLGTGGGPTWDAGTNYTWAYSQHSQIPNGTNLGGAADTKIKAGNSLASTSTKGASGDLKLYNPQSTTAHKNLVARLAMTDSSGNFVGSSTGAIYLSTTAVTGVRFLFSTGNIASGTIRMYGLKAS